MTEKGGEKSAAERGGAEPGRLRGVSWLFLCIYLLFSWRRAGRERQEEVRRISPGKWGGMFPKKGRRRRKEMTQRWLFSRVSFGLVLVREKRAVRAVCCVRGALPRS